MLRQDLPDEKRIRCLWLSFFGVAVLITGTTAYYIAEIRAGFFNDISRVHLACGSSSLAKMCPT